MVVRCEVLTVEIEHVDVATLEILEQQGIDCQPRASTIRIIQVCLFFMCTFGFESHLYFKCKSYLPILRFSVNLLLWEPDK